MQAMQITCPAGVMPGQELQVQTPSGMMMKVVVPQGVMPGNAFQVQYAEPAGLAMQQPLMMGQPVEVVQQPFSMGQMASSLPVSAGTTVAQVIQGDFTGNGVVDKMMVMPDGSTQILPGQPDNRAEKLKAELEQARSQQDAADSRLAAAAAAVEEADERVERAKAELTAAQQKLADARVAAEKAVEERVAAQTAAEDAASKTKQLQQDLSSPPPDASAPSQVMFTQAGVPMAQSAVEQKKSLMISVPPGVAAGTQLEFTTPDGRKMRISVPQGVQPGQQLQVQY